MHGSVNHSKHNGFAALGKSIGTSKSTETDANYVTEHQVLKYLRVEVVHCLHDYCSHWFLRYLRRMESMISFVRVRSDG